MGNRGSRALALWKLELKGTGDVILEARVESEERHLLEVFRKAYGLIKPLDLALHGDGRWAG